MAVSRAPLVLAAADRVPRRAGVAAAAVHQLVRRPLEHKSLGTLVEGQVATHRLQVLALRQVKRRHPSYLAELVHTLYAPD